MRESRTPGSVRGKPDGLPTRPPAGIHHIDMAGSGAEDLVNTRDLIGSTLLRTRVLCCLIALRNCRMPQSLNYLNTLQFRKSAEYTLGQPLLTLSWLRSETFSMVNPPIHVWSISVEHSKFNTTLLELVTEAYEHGIGIIRKPWSWIWRSSAARMPSPRRGPGIVFRTWLSGAF